MVVACHAGLYRSSRRGAMVFARVLRDGVQLGTTLMYDLGNYSELEVGVSTITYSKKAWRC